MHIEKRGRPRFSGSRRLASTNRFNVLVSDADGLDVKTQVSDAMAFLTNRQEGLIELSKFMGVQSAYLDFGVECRLGAGVAVQCDYFPAELLRLAGECGLGLEVSLYPASAHRFRVQLHRTYYLRGFFNVGVDDDRHLGPEGPVQIQFGDAPTVVRGRIDRHSNRNGTARVLGGSVLRDVFQSQWSLGDTLIVEVSEPDVLRLRRSL